jgi:hypothetical protein
MSKAQLIFVLVLACLVASSVSFFGFATLGPAVGFSDGHGG